MTKEEVIKILHKEVGLIFEFESEDKKGDLYITEKKFKKASEVIKKLEEMRETCEAKEKKLIEIIKSNKGSYIDISDKFLVDKIVKVVNGDLIFVQPKNIIFNQGSFLADRVF